MKRAIVAAMTVAVALVACDDKKVTTAPVASSLAPSIPAPTTNKTLKFAIDPRSATTIDMPAPKEHIKAVTEGAMGTIEVDLMNLANTRGEIKADMLSLTTKTFDDAAKDKSQTTHARTWLEVADGEEGKLDDSVKNANRWAVYAIRSIENLSATDLIKIAPTKAGTEEVRTVTATTRGELLLHGHKVDRDADVEDAFHYPVGGAADKPSSLTIKSKKPFRTTLSDYDVKPRDGFGKIAKGAFNLIGTKVAEVADVSLDLRATPQP